MLRCFWKRTNLPGWSERMGGAMNRRHEYRLGGFSRRELLRRSGMGLGSLALGTLLNAAETGAETAGPLAPKAPPLAARARRVVHLFMNGGPSHVDTFDPKPMLDKYAG